MGTLTVISALGIILACRLFGTHKVLRWPIFLILGAVIALELALYVLVRLAIRFIAAFSFRERRRDATLEEASTYSEWLALAELADAEEGRDAWRDLSSSKDYDWRHVQVSTQRLRAAREAGDITALMQQLLPLLKHNAFGELEYSLYTRARAGTKRLIEAYRDELCESLRALAMRAATADGSGVTRAALREFSLAARASFGGAALMLSGGALFGVFHFGVVKALVDERLLPTVVCGASAGAVVASIVCSRSDDELRHLMHDKSDLYREMGSHGPFFGTTLWKIQRVLTRGRIYDFALWHKHMKWFSLGLTFKEAFEKTGRVLNITCTPVRSRGRRAAPLLLNHLTAPHVDIASAVCASACVPLLIEPVVLLEKSPIDGKLRKYASPDDDDDCICYRDGSYESDVPIGGISATFGTTFTIVSQVNPHVVPFYAHLQGRPGRPSGGRDHTGAWRGGFLLCALEVALKNELRSAMRTMQQLGLLVDLFGVDWSHLWLQSQDGSVVLTPDLKLSHFTDRHLLSNVASLEDLNAKMRGMERATWEGMGLIRTRMDVDAALSALEGVAVDVPVSRVPSATGPSRQDVNRVLHAYPAAAASGCNRMLHAYPVAAEQPQADEPPAPEQQLKRRAAASPARTCARH